MLVRKLLLAENNSSTKEKAFLPNFKSVQVCLCLFKANVLEHGLSAGLLMYCSQTGVQTAVVTAVRLLRVLRDGKTSVVVQVLESNAVLKCEVKNSSTHHLQQGQTATIQSLEYDPPVLRVSINSINSMNGINSMKIGAEAETSCASCSDTKDILLTQQPRLRKRMCFD